MAEKKLQQTPISDTQVEQIIENAADAFEDIPVVDDLYRQDEYWTDAIDMDMSLEQDAADHSPWNIDVREGQLIEHNEPLAPIELEAEEFQYEEDHEVVLRYADHFEW